MQCVTERMSLGEILVQKNVFNQSPPYQRESAVWSEEKQQLFIDSLLNKFDVPKIYLHDLRSKAGKYDYAIIDGKQRLGTVWRFFDGELVLSADFKIFNRPKGTTEKELPRAKMGFVDLKPKWQEIVKSRSLDVVFVQDADEEDIEELFSRLNNGEPLNAAEKRNAMGGVIPGLIRDVAAHKFFKKHVSVPNTRYQHLEAAAKILLIEKAQMDGADYIVDLKKRFLDKLVQDNKNLPVAKVDDLRRRTLKQLDVTSRAFKDNDHLLRKQASVPLYHLFVKGITDEYGDEKLFSKLQQFLEDFQLLRQKNLEEPDEEKRDPVLLEFDRLNQQGTNDRRSLQSRISTLSRYFLQKHPEVTVKDKKRLFSSDERYVIWVRGDRHCQNCNRSLALLSDMAADHVAQWAHGGQTKLVNARCLCPDCNEKLKKKVA